MIDIREYRTTDGRSPFAEWRATLDAEARRRITAALYRMGLGNFSIVKGVGAAFLNVESILAPVIACTSAKMATGS